MASPSAAARSCWTRRSRPSASTPSPSPYIRKSKSASPSPSREVPMRPNASTVVRTSLPARKIRMQPPKRSRPPANSSIRKLSTTSNRGKMPLPKSNAHFLNPSCDHPSPARSGRACYFRRRFFQHRDRRQCGCSVFRDPVDRAKDIRRDTRCLPSGLDRAPAIQPGAGRKTRPGELYWEIGGTGGPEAAAGAGGGAEAVTAGGSDVTGADGRGAAACSAAPLETAADDAAGAGGAGVTAGTGSARNTGGVPLPLSLGPSTFAASDLPSPAGLVSSGLPLSSLAGSLLDSAFGDSSLPASLLAVSDFAASDLAASDLAVSALGASSPPGLPRLLSLCLAVNLRASSACTGACPSTTAGFVSSGPAARRASRLWAWQAGAP